MFSLSGLVKTLGTVMSVFIAASCLLGFIQINNTAIILTILYTLCYILNGILAPIWNKETPYFASFISSVTLTFMNMLFAVFVLDIMVFADSGTVNNGLARNSIISLLMTFLAIKIRARKQRMQKC
ncbi:hypothetical protein ACNQFZ_09745 [Schinkia sp. CFF1]